MTFPSHLQTNKIGNFYKKIFASPQPLELDLWRCLWAEHFELQKLALFLAARSRNLDELSIRLTHADVSAEDSELSLKVIAFAHRLGFFQFLASYYPRLKITGADRDISVDGIPNELNIPISPRVATERDRIIPFQEIGTLARSQAVTKRLGSTDELRVALDRYAELNFLASGEFNLLLVGELLENVVEHSKSHTGSDPVGLISLRAHVLGQPSQTKSSYSRRLTYAPLYERRFLQTLRAPGYLELDISDAGVGIVESLRSGRGTWSEWFNSSMPGASDADFFCAAFSALSTSDPGPHRPGYRGLFYVLEFIREHGGALACESSGMQLAYVPNVNADAPLFRQADLDRPFKPDTIGALSVNPLGTHFRILLPLASRRRRQRPWQVNLQKSVPQLAQVTPFELPIAQSLPSAPSIEALEADRRVSMEGFRAQCSSILGTSQPYAGGAIWLSAARTRAWRKQHIQAFLNELKQCPFKAIVILNLPTQQFETLVFIARHFLSVEDGYLMLIHDEQGRRALVYRDPLPSFERFNWWCNSGERYADIRGPITDLLTEFAGRLAPKLKEVTFSELLFLLMPKGLDQDFLQSVLRFSCDQPVRVGRTAITGYVELDEAISRDQAYILSLAAWIHLAQSLSTPTVAIIALHRAASRLLDVSLPSGPDLWRMKTPAPEHAPPSAWLSGQSKIVVVTDVVYSGSTVSNAVEEITRRMDRALGEVSIIVPVLLRNPSAPYNTGTNEARISGGWPIVLIETASQGTVPALFVHSIPVTEVAEGEKALVPDAWTGIAFEPSPLAEYGWSMPPGRLAQFIDATSRARATVIGHVAITGAHFDVEFDIARLLTPAEGLVKEICKEILGIFETEDVNLVVFPDESRIHFLLPHLEDSLRDAARPAVKLVRLRRAINGHFYCRANDATEMRSAKRVLFLDDAVNSGNTAREMLLAVLDAAPNVERCIYYAIISRQTFDQFRALSAVKFVQQVPFRYRAFIHLPIRFYAQESCPLCSRDALANALATATSNHSIAIHLYAACKSLRAREYYPWRTSPMADFRRKYSIPVSTVAEDAIMHCDTLSAAKVIIATDLGVRPSSVSEHGQYLSKLVSDYPELFSYGIYHLAVRYPRSEALWSNEEVLRAIHDFVSQLGPYLRPPFRSPDERVMALALEDLICATWFAPIRSAVSTLADIVKHCIFLTSSEELLGHLLLACVRVGNFARGLIHDAHTPSVLDPLSEAIRAAQDANAGEGTRGEGLAPDAILRQMRLRWVDEIISGREVTQIWLDQVPELLTALSYKAGHDFVPLLSGDDRARVTHLLRAANSLSGNMTQDPVILSRPQPQEDEFWQDVATFVAIPTRELQRLAIALVPGFGPLFRALCSAGRLSLAELGALEKDLEEGAQKAKDLHSSLSELPRCLLKHDLAAATACLNIVAQQQTSLFQILFGPTPTRAKALLRETIDSVLSQLYDVVGSMNREVVRERFHNKRLGLGSRSVQLEGSYFDYVDKFKAKRQGADVTLPWRIILAPPDLIESVLTEILIINPAKHVFQSAPQSASLTLVAEIQGLETSDPHLRFRVSTQIDGRTTQIPVSIFEKTVSKLKKSLHVFGGDVLVDDSAGWVVVKLLAGHF